MVMVWLEGGQGEVRGACAPPPPPPPQIAAHGPPSHPTLPERPAPSKPLLDPPPHCPSLKPPSNASPPAPPARASGQQLVGGVVGVQNRGVAPPPPPGF